MTALASAKTMMSTAETEAFAAGLVLTPAMMVNFQFKLAEGEAENLDKAGQKWRESAAKIQKASADLQTALAGVPAETWSADDRRAYELKVRDLCVQLEVIATYYMAVGIALTAFAYALFVFAIFAVGMGTFLGALAVAAAAALAGVVTAEFYAVCLEVAVTCLTVTWSATAILAGAAQMAGAVFQGGAALTAVLEFQHGNDKALSDFARAEAVGAAAALANLAQNAANAGLAYANRSGGIKVPGGGKGSPLESIDLDADRDKDHTWDLGGGVKGKTAGGDEFSGSGHVKIGDHGLQGVEVEGSGGRNGHTVDGKFGYEDEDGVGHGKGGTLSGEFGYSHTNETTGREGEVKVGGEYNTETGDWKADGSGSVTTAGGNTVGVEGGYDSKEQTATGGLSYGREGAAGQSSEVKIGGEYNTGNGDWKTTGSGGYTTEGGNTVGVNGGYGSDGDGTVGGEYQNTGTGLGYKGHYDSQTGQWVSE